jgi:predicted metalloprotease with PDZ domain
MRALWRDYGKPATRPGYVDRPYTMSDLETTLAAVGGDGAFARDFFGRYIRGRELADYARLLKPAGFVFRPVGRGRVEVVTVEATGGSLTAEQRAFREAWLGAI